MKEIDDLITYLTEIRSLAKPLNAKQKDQLREVIRVILILLVALRKSSHLGESAINFVI